MVPVAVAVTAAMAAGGGAPLCRAGKARLPRSRFWRGRRCEAGTGEDASWAVVPMVVPVVVVAAAMAMAVAVAAMAVAGAGAGPGVGVAGVIVLSL